MVTERPRKRNKKNIFISFIIYLFYSELIVITSLSCIKKIKITLVATNTEHYIIHKKSRNRQKSYLNASSTKKIMFFCRKNFIFLIYEGAIPTNIMLWHSS